MNESSALSKFIDFVSGVLRRPGMYQVNNIEDLNLLIFGFSIGCNSKEVFSLLDDYRLFVNQEFKSTNNYDWARLIRFYSSGDLQSLDLFKSKFKSFLKYKNISYLKVE